MRIAGFPSQLCRAFARSRRRSRPAYGVMNNRTGYEWVLSDPLMVVHLERPRKNVLLTESDTRANERCRQLRFIELFLSRQVGHFRQQASGVLVLSEGSKTGSGSILVLGDFRLNESRTFAGRSFFSGWFDNNGR